MKIKIGVCTEKSQSSGILPARDAFHEREDSPKEGAPHGKNDSLDGYTSREEGFFRKFKIVHPTGGRIRVHLTGRKDSQEESAPHGREDSPKEGAPHEDSQERVLYNPREGRFSKRGCTPRGFSKRGAAQGREDSSKEGAPNGREDFQKESAHRGR